MGQCDFKPPSPGVFKYDGLNFEMEDGGSWGCPHVDGKWKVRVLLDGNKLHDSGTFMTNIGVRGSDDFAGAWVGKKFSIILFNANAYCTEKWGSIFWGVTYTPTEANATNATTM